MSDKNKLVAFQNQNIRRIWHNEEWYFSVVDIVEVLTDSKDVKQYIKKLRLRDPALDLNWGTICTLLKIQAPDGKMRASNCVNTKNSFRLIQSIPSKKAEPFKQWLAKVGYERIKEIEDPELAQKRMKEIYKAKGYSDDWIEKRVRGIIIRDELTEEWDKRGIEGKEFAILTADISKATFDLNPSEHKKLKGLKRENLRDHMNDLELIFSMLGEASTIKIAKNKDAQGFLENQDAAKKGGKVAGVARSELEKQTGEKVVSESNFLHLNEKKKKRLN